MKKFWVTLLSVLLLVSCVAFVSACKDDKVLTNYVLSESGSLVESDFVLPLKVNEKDVEWESSDATALTIEKRTEDYLAKIILGDEAKPVTLTVKCGKESKTFGVTVAALDVSYFVKKYNFKQNNSAVIEDFALDTETKIGDKTATISWSVNDEHKKFIDISADGKTCIVKSSTLNPEVRIYATFKYKDVTSKVPYRMTVSFQRTPLEEVDYWYYNTGVSIKMSGYLVAIGTAYSSQYNNVTFYMINDDFTAGYYIYRATCNDETGKALKPGDHITVTNSTNTNYNGLIETNQGGILTLDKDKPALSEADLNAKVHAIDNDILSGSPAALYHTSRLVSLDKWTVKSVEKDAPAEGSTATLFTLTKDGKDVKVCVSKYLEGVYAAKKDNATWAALAALQGSIKVNDVVSVKGILSNNNGFQIIPFKAEDVVKETVAATATSDAVKNVGKAITAIQKLLVDNGVSGSGKSGYTIVADKEITVPTTSNGVEVKCELLHDSERVAIANGKITVTVGDEDKAGFKVTYTAKDGETVLYETCTFHILHSLKLTDEEVADNIHFELEVAEKITGAYQLPVSSNKYPGSKITWALKDAVDGVSVSADGKVTNTTADKDAVIVATIKYGTKTLTKEFKVKVTKVSPVETGKFVLVMQQPEKKLYFKGEITDKGYGATTENIAEAAQVIVAKAEGGHTLKVGDKFLELNADHKPVLVDASTGVWVYDYVTEVFTWTVGEKVYYLGTYENKGTIYDTISASETKYISGDNASKIGVSQFPAKLVKTEVPTGAFKMTLLLPEKTLYFKGEFKSGKGVTTDKLAEAATVVIAETDGGHTLKIGDKYLALEKVTSGDKTYTNVCLSDTATVWVYDLGLKVFTIKFESKTYYLGTYENKGTINDTISASETKYISGDNASKVGVSQFPVQLQATAETGTFKLALQQNNPKVNKKLYFNGEITDKGYGSTTENVAEAVDVVVAQVEGGYTLKVGEKYLELVASGKYINLTLVDAPTGAWVFDSNIKVLTWTVGEKIYYLGTYSNYTTISASETFRISGDKAADVGVSQFVAFFEKPGAGTPPPDKSGEEH